MSVAARLTINFDENGTDFNSNPFAQRAKRGARVLISTCVESVYTRVRLHTSYLYRRYVDDCFVIFRCPDYVKPFLDYLNSQHNSIKFSSETEVNNTLPFPDVLIERNNGFSSSVYRKPTFSGLFTNFDSFIPLSFKRGLVYTLLDRCFKTSTSYHIFHSEVIKLKNPLIYNGYPMSFFDLCLPKFLDKVFSVSAKKYDVSRRVIYYSMPSMGNIAFKSLRS